MIGLENYIKKFFNLFKRTKESEEISVTSSSSYHTEIELHPYRQRKALGAFRFLSYTISRPTDCTMVQISDSDNTRYSTEDKVKISGSARIRHVVENEEYKNLDEFDIYIYVLDVISNKREVAKFTKVSLYSSKKNLLKFKDLQKGLEINFIACNFEKDRRDHNI